MPGLSGIDVLIELKSRGIDVPVVMVSALTVEGGELTLRALELGAIDFITKPEANFRGQGIEILARSLAPVLAGIEQRRAFRNMVPDRQSNRPCAANLIGHSSSAVSSVAFPRAFPEPTGPSEVVAIGVSTGGPQALTELLPRFPAEPGVPIIIVQHMPPIFTATLAKNLSSRCAFPVREAENGEPVRPNVAYIAPGGRQLRVALGTDGITKLLRVTDDPPENNCRPSVDYLFRSVAHHYYGRLTAVVMTGMGADGLRGAELVKRSGGRVLVQDAASCVVYGMPREIVRAGLADGIHPLDSLHAAILETVSRS